LAGLDTDLNCEGGWIRELEAGGDDLNECNPSHSDVLVWSYSHPYLSFFFCASVIGVEQAVGVGVVGVEVAGIVEAGLGRAKGYVE
jgi:hypothetical protein